MTQAILTVGNIFSEAFQGLFELVHDMKAKATLHSFQFCF